MYLLRNIWANIFQSAPIIGTQDSPQRPPWAPGTAYLKQKPGHLHEKPQHIYILQVKGS